MNKFATKLEFYS